MKFPVIQKYFSQQSLKKQMAVALVTMSTLPLLAIGVAANYITNSALTSQSEAIQTTHAKDLQHKVYNFMQDRLIDIRVLASLDMLTNSDLRRQTSSADKALVLDRLRAQYEIYDSIAVFDLDGEVIAQTQGIRLDNHLNRTYIQAALQENGAILSAPSISSTEKTFNVYAASVIHDSETQEPVGFIRVRMPVDVLHELVQNYGYSGSNYYLIDQGNSVFLNTDGAYQSNARSDRSTLDNPQAENTGLSISEIFPALDSTNLTEQALVQLAFNQQSEAKEFVAYSPPLEVEGLPKLGWSVALATDRDNVFALQRKLDKIFVVGAVIAIVILGFIAVYLSRRLTKPLTLVTEGLQQLGQGKLDTRVAIEGSKELNVLGQSINAMAAKIESLIAERAEQLETLYSLNRDLESRTAQLETEVDERKQAEQALKDSQVQLIQTEKMSSLGQLVAGVAHELNNPINFIYGNIAPAEDYIADLLQLIELYEAEFPEATPLIQEEIEAVDLDFLKGDLANLLSSMKVGANRVAEIVRSLRNFSRLDEAEVKTADIHEGIDSTLMILNSRLKANHDQPGINVVKEYGDLPLVECYPGQLNQVLMNIFANAIDALEEFNKTRTRNDILDNPSTIRISTEVLEHRLLFIRISDNGPGIPDKVQSRLFEPFFTTKAVGKGTGLGLSISYQIITEQHNGCLSCYSTPEEGTTFVIEIPIRHSSLSKKTSSASGLIKA